MVDKKVDRLKKENRELKKVVKILSNQEIMLNINSAIEDFKKGRYTVLTN